MTSIAFGIQNEAGELLALTDTKIAGFERGVSPRTVRYAPDRAAKLIEQMARCSPPTVASAVPLAPLSADDQHELFFFLNPSQRCSRQRCQPRKPRR